MGNWSFKNSGLDSHLDTLGGQFDKLGRKSWQTVGMQYNSSGMKPYQVGIGGMRLDMRDPRVLAALALGPSAGALGPYAVGRQAEIQKQDRRLEDKYVPMAEARSKQQAQAANYGGTTGGLGEASSQQAYDQIMQILHQQKKMVRAKHAQQEAQFAQLAAMIGGTAMGGPGVGAAASTGVGMGATYLTP